MASKKDIFPGMEMLHVRNKDILSKERILSVDALRGFDMFWIMGGDMMFKGLDSVFHNRLTGFLKTQMDHVEWFGFHFYDIIMPLFLFLAGFSMVYSFRKRLASSSSDRALLKHTFQRIIILWILGMMVQGRLLSYNPSQFQFYSNTLQAIAAGYLIASLFVLYLPVKHQLFSTAGLLAIYWAILVLVPKEGGAVNTYSPEYNVAFMVEKAVMGKHIGWGTYTWVVSSLNFGATVMLGVFSGYMMQTQKPPYKKFMNYILLGGILLITAFILDIWHPVIKKIWTSSFVLFSGGICILLLAAFYLLIDVWRWRKGTKWLIILGSNAILGYVAWHLFEQQFVGMAGVFLKGLESHIGEWMFFLSYLGGFGVIFLVLWFMHKHKVFIKI